MGADPLALDPDLVRVLSGITTATLTTVLLKKGLRNVWMRGTRPLQPGQPRLVGRAFTLRFVPAREDLTTPASWGAPISTRAAIEAMPAGCFARRGGCRGSRAGKAGGLDHVPGRRWHTVTRSVPTERRDQGSLRSMGAHRALTQKYPVRVDHTEKEAPLLAATGSSKPFRHPIRSGVLA